MSNFKRIVPGIISLIIAITACTNEPKTFEEEVRQLYRDKRGFFFIKIPPALMNLALSVSDDPDMSRFFGDASQVGIISFGDGFPSEENPDLVRNLEDILSRHGYQDLIRISDSDQMVTMMMKEISGAVTDLITIVSQPQGNVMAIILSGEIDLNQVAMMATELDFDKLMNFQAMGRRR